jgi:hypothetical protein
LCRSPAFWIPPICGILGSGTISFFPAFDEIARLTGRAGFVAEFTPAIGGTPRNDLLESHVWGEFDNHRFSNVEYDAIFFYCRMMY